MTKYIPPSKRNTYKSTSQKSHLRRLKSKTLADLNNEMKENLQYNQYLNNKLFGPTCKLSPQKQIPNKNNYIDNESKNNKIKSETVPTPKTVPNGSNNIDNNANDMHANPYPTSAINPQKIGENNIEDADDPYVTKNSKNDKIYCNENDTQYKAYSSTLLTNTPINPSANPTTDRSKDHITIYIWIIIYLLGILSNITSCMVNANEHKIGEAHLNNNKDESSLSYPNDKKLIENSTKKLGNNKKLYTLPPSHLKVTQKIFDGRKTHSLSHSNITPATAHSDLTHTEAHSNVTTYSNSTHVKSHSDNNIDHTDEIINENANKNGGIYTQTSNKTLLNGTNNKILNGISTISFKDASTEPSTYPTTAINPQKIGKNKIENMFETETSIDTASINSPPQLAHQINEKLTKGAKLIEKFGETLGGDKISYKLHIIQILQIQFQILLYKCYYM